MGRLLFKEEVGTMNARQLSNLEIQRMMDQAAEALAVNQGVGPVGWLSYLLEALENELDRDEYQDVLDGLRKNVAFRLEQGQW